MPRGPITSRPLIKDTDPDLDRHLGEYQSTIDCHIFGRRDVRHYDVLTVFRKALAPGSVRLRVYGTAITRARKHGRLPHKAKGVFDDRARRSAIG